MVSVSGKLTVKPACELLRSHGVSLATVEFLVRVFFIQRASVDHAADAGNYVVRWCRCRISPRLVPVVGGSQAKGRCAWGRVGSLGRSRHPES